MIKKISGIFLIVSIILPGLFFPSMEVEAKTLLDLKNELQALEEEQNQNEQQQKLTQEEINRIASSITTNTNTINQLSKDMIALQEEITQAEKDIEEKDKEIKELINFLQVSSGESAYLEYAFGAKNFTDFIYRMAISEQLSSYNEELMNQYNALIDSNKKKKIEVSEKQETLRKKQIELALQKEKLGEDLKTTSNVGISIKDAIALQKTQIEYYKKIGCKDDETIDDCMNRTQVLPAGTAFYRPVVSGTVTSEFGSRCYWLGKKYKCDLHGGIDLAQHGENIPVYAAAPGIVAGIVREWECGGNEVIIIHNINGKKYTTLYAHLRQITVKNGQVVTLDTQIGIMGGDPSRETWDSCSTAQHVHFTIANGHYGTDYKFYEWYTKFEPNMFDPRIMLNVPGTGKSFNNRFRKY